MIWITAFAIALLSATTAGDETGNDPGAWQAPFDSLHQKSGTPDSRLTLDQALGLVARSNSLLRSLESDKLAALAGVDQSGLWSNPELEFEIEEFGWDSPGFDQAEIALAVAQELELFGQRGARRHLARTTVAMTEWESQVAAFDLYLEVKHRYYALAHAQARVELTEATVELTENVVENIEYRIERGAALRSELLLAQLEMQRARLAHDQARQETQVARENLAALWGSEPADFDVSAVGEPDLTQSVTAIDQLSHTSDSARGVIGLLGQAALTRAERELAKADARPTLTLSGGYKHLRAEKSNSFLLGISLPLPFWNRNQGAQRQLEAQLRSLEYRIEHQRRESTAAIRSGVIHLRRLAHQHAHLDSLLVPTAEEVYADLRQSYQAGRLPYTQLLEAERMLNELRHEHNDIILAIHEQIIALESHTGVSLRIDKETE